MRRKDALLTPRDVREIRRRRGNGWTIDGLSVAYGVTPRTIYRALATRRIPHYCDAGCGVATPRPLCYFHARSAA